MILEYEMKNSRSSQLYWRFLPDAVHGLTEAVLLARQISGLIQ